MDLYERRDPGQVLNNLNHLASLCQSNPSFKGPQLPTKVPEPGSSKSTRSNSVSGTNDAPRGRGKSLSHRGVPSHQLNAAKQEGPRGGSPAGIAGRPAGSPAGPGGPSMNQPGGALRGSRGGQPPPGSRGRVLRGKPRGRPRGTPPTDAGRGGGARSISQSLPGEPSPPVVIAPTPSPAPSLTPSPVFTPAPSPVSTPVPAPSPTHASSAPTVSLSNLVPMAPTPKATPISPTPSTDKPVKKEFVFNPTLSYTGKKAEAPVNISKSKAKPAVKWSNVESNNFGHSNVASKVASVTSLDNDIATKEMFKYDPDMERSVVDWLENVSGQKKVGSLADWIKDGVILCKYVLFSPFFFLFFPFRLSPSLYPSLFYFLLPLQPFLTPRQFLHFLLHFKCSKFKGDNIMI